MVMGRQPAASSEECAKWGLPGFSPIFSRPSVFLKSDRPLLGAQGSLRNQVSFSEALPRALPVTRTEKARPPL